MEGLDLLTQANAAGLEVMVEGDELVIRGPKRAKAIALELLAHKAVVMAALSSSETDGNADGPGQYQTDAHQQATPPRSKALRETEPVEISVAGKTYLVKQIVGMWFSQLTPAAGWTCCEDGSVRIIEDALSTHAADDLAPGISCRGGDRHCA